eukprot:gene11360-biopygen15409
MVTSCCRQLPPCSAVALSHALPPQPPGPEPPPPPFQHFGPAWVSSKPTPGQRCFGPCGFCTFAGVAGPVSQLQTLNSIQGTLLRCCADAETTNFGVGVVHPLVDYIILYNERAGLLQGPLEESQGGGGAWRSQSRALALAPPPGVPGAARGQKSEFFSDPGSKFRKLGNAIPERITRPRAC